MKPVHMNDYKEGLWAVASGIILVVVLGAVAVWAFRVVFGVR